MIESKKKAEGVVVFRFFINRNFLVNSPRQNLLSEWENK